jgi:hypothetical protein
VTEIFFFIHPSRIQKKKEVTGGKRVAHGIHAAIASEMAATDFELREPWFYLIATFAFTFLPVTLAPLAKLAMTFDKKALFCKSPLRYISGLWPVILCVLAHLGLFTTGFYIHLNESDIGSDTYFYEINIILLTAGLLMAFFPHLYTLNWYDYKKQKKYVGLSYSTMSTISNYLTPITSFFIWCLFLVAIILLGIDGRWTAFGVLLGYEILITLATIYLALELLWCSSAFRALVYKYGRGGYEALGMAEDNDDVGSPMDSEMKAFGGRRATPRRKNARKSPYGGF